MKAAGPANGLRGVAAFRDVLRSRDFVRLLLALLVSTFGNWICVLAVISLAAFRWDASPAEVAGLLVVILLPTALFAPISGSLADRFDRRRLLVTADIVRAGIVLLLPFTQNTAQMYVVLFALSSIGTVYPPTVASIIPTIVPRDALMPANAAATQCAQVTKVLGPVAAALVVATLGTTGVFALDAATFLISGALILSLRTVPRHSLSTSERPGAIGLGGMLREAITSVLSSRRLTVLVVTAIVGTAAFGAVEAALPVYVREFVSGGTTLYAAAVSAAGLGSVFGAFALAVAGLRAERLRVVFAGLAVAAICTLLFIALPLRPVAVVLSWGMAAGGAAALVAGHTLIQEEVPADRLGRIFGVLTGTTSAAMIGAMMLAGIVIAAWGIPALFLGLSALLTLTVVSGVAALSGKKAWKVHVLTELAGSRKTAESGVPAAWEVSPQIGIPSPRAATGRGGRRGRTEHRPFPHPAETSTAGPHQAQQGAGPRSLLEEVGGDSPSLDPWGAGSGPAAGIRRRRI